MVPLDNGFLSINGTPTDCVHLALTGWLAELPEMVVSGINAGANLGDDVLYSGTVAAAIEGRFLGFPTLAVSLVGNHNKLENYATAGECARRIVEHLLVNPLAKETIFNVNVPDLPLSEVKGIQVTRLGARHRAEQMVRSHDPRGRPIYWLGPAGAGQDIGPGTDFYAVNHGYVSVTPLKTDLTDHHALDGMQHWFSQFRLVPV
jgi:5'-nucleotidase